MFRLKLTNITTNITTIVIFSYLRFMISLSTVFWMSSRLEDKLPGCDAVGDNSEVTGNGDRGCKGLKGVAAAAAKGEWLHAYGEWTSVGGVGNPEVVVGVTLEFLKALAMAAMATAATALPDPWGTGIRGGGTGK